MAVSTDEEYQKIVKEETTRLEAVRESVKKDIADLHDQKVKETEEISRLKAVEQKLRESVTGLTHDVVDLQEKIAPLEKELPALGAKIKSATENLNSIVGRTANQKEAHDTFVAHKAKLEADVAQLSKELENKTKQKANLDIELIDTQKKIAEHKQQMTDRETEANTRAGNAARLELHVNEKLAHLKELESHFTTEHLARTGYKKTD